MGGTNRVWMAGVVVILLLAHDACGQGPSYLQSELQSENLLWQPDQETITTFPGISANTGWDDPSAVAGPLRFRSTERRSGCRSRLWSEFQEGKYKVRSDYRNFYSWPGIRDLLLGLAAGSVLANTSLDRDFQDWYQEDVRSPGTDDFTSFSKAFGEGRIFIPAFAGLAVAGAICSDNVCGSLLHEYASRTTRGYLVGVPPLLFLQAFLGGGRPEWDTNFESRWGLFDDNGGAGGKAVSGHAMMGAVPFITAAKMTDNPFLKTGLYVCSTFTGWSRVNDDSHYLSQACLGWWLAYLACSAVDTTDYDDERLTLTPLATPEMVGIGVIYRR